MSYCRGLALIIKQQNYSNDYPMPRVGLKQDVESLVLLLRDFLSFKEDNIFILTNPSKDQIDAFIFQRKLFFVHILKCIAIAKFSFQLKLTKKISKMLNV